MKVLVVEPQKLCRVQEIESLADMQQLVGVCLSNENVSKRAPKK